jgi:hypothetical protein
MTGIQPTLAQDVPDQPRLAIPDDVAACLSTSLRSELASLPPEQQQAFVEAFQSKSANLAMAYLLSLCYCHYGLLGRWAMTGWMCLSLFVTSTLGVIWWLIDLVRMPRMVREHNHRVATDLLHELRCGATPSPLPGA